MATSGRRCGDPGVIAVLIPALSVLLAFALGSSWLRLARCQPDVSETSVRTIIVNSPAELDRLTRQLKGSCYPYVLRLDFLHGNVSRWTPEYLARSEEAWAVTRGTPIIGLDAARRSSSSQLQQQRTDTASEMPLGSWLAMDEAERAQHYPRTPSRRYDGLGFGDDFQLLFGSSGGADAANDGGSESPPALLPHELFDFSVGANIATETASELQRRSAYVATLRLSGRGNAWAPHLDHGINHVLQLHGDKAWSLFHFREAEALYLDTDPASLTFRHSLRDPARPFSFLRWCSARGTRVVLSPGDLLYLQS